MHLLKLLSNHGSLPLRAKRSRLPEPDRDAETSAGNAPNRGALLSAGCRITPANRTSVPGSRPIGHESPPLPLSGSPRRFPRRGSGCQDVQRSAPAIVLPHFAVPIVELGAATRRPFHKRGAGGTACPRWWRSRRTAVSSSYPIEQTPTSQCGRGSTPMTYARVIPAILRSPAKAVVLAGANAALSELGA
jgi:hypothetical protein